MAEHPKDPEINPALTAKEWREQLSHDVYFSRTSGHGEIAAHIYASLAGATDGGLPEGATEALEISWNNTERVVQVWDRHKLAALCLYGTPEGFTQEDVASLRSAIRWLDEEQTDDISAPLLRILKRISALLPPPETL
jgi:hypothetical protein